MLESPWLFSAITWSNLKLWNIHERERVGWLKWCGRLSAVLGCKLGIRIVLMVNRGGSIINYNDDLQYIENWPTKILLTLSWVLHHTSLFQGFEKEEAESKLNYSLTFRPEIKEQKQSLWQRPSPSLALDFDDDHCWRWRFLKLEIKARAPVSCC